MDCASRRLLNSAADRDDLNMVSSSRMGGGGRCAAWVAGRVYVHEARTPASNDWRRGLGALGKASAAAPSGGRPTGKGPRPSN
jgi:hypothetical protein